MSDLSLGMTNARSLMSVNKYHFCLEKRSTSLAGKGKMRHERQEVEESEVIILAEKDGSMKVE